MKRIMSYCKVPHKNVSLFIFLFILPWSAHAGGDQQPRLTRESQYNIQVAGPHVSVQNDIAFTIRDGNLVKSGIQAKYVCRTYQGAITSVQIQTKDGSEIIATRSHRYEGTSGVHNWRDIPIAKLSALTNKCLNKTHNQILDIPIRLWNTCGRDGRHTRNGGGTIRLNLQCSPSTIEPIVKPILWRYECNGPNMFIEGTSKKYVEKRTDSDRVMCVYRAPVPRIKGR